MNHTYKRSPNFKKEIFPVQITIQENRPTLVSMHWHEELEFIRVLSGPVLVQLNETKFVANTGDIIFIENNCIHYVHSIGAFDKSIQGLVFSKQIFGENILSLSSLTAYASFLGKGVFCFNTLHKDHSFFVDCMEQLYQEYVHEAPFYQMAVHGLLQQMMSRLLRYYSDVFQENPQMQKKVAKLNRLQPVLTYLKDNYVSNITLLKLAQKANMGEYYFSRFFKDVMDCPPIEFVNRYRLRMSIRQLINSDQSIALIAEQAGFSTCNYFDRSFRKVYGMSPSEYRKLSREESGF